MYQRLRIILLLMIGMTLFAGYVGLLFLPSLLVVWLVAALALASPVVFVAPALIGAQIAWPVTCVVLPAASIAIRPARVWAPVFLLILGAGSGWISGNLLARSVGYGTTEDLLWACVFSGAFSGALFGYAMWRFDRLSPVEVEETGSPQTAARIKWLNIALPLVFIVLSLTYLAFSESAVEPFLDRNGIKACSERGGKLSPREVGQGFRCVLHQRNN